jgi:hypothetical protein
MAFLVRPLVIEKGGVQIENKYINPCIPHFAVKQEC